MNFRIILVVATLALAAMPVGSSAPACNTFTQSRTVGGVTTTITITSCRDTYYDPVNDYGYEWWQNATSVIVTDGAGSGASFVDYGQWSYYYNNANNYRAEGWSRSYYAGAYDGAGDMTYAQATSQQGEYAGMGPPQCYGGFYFNQYQGLRTGTGVGANGGQQTGDSQPVPCTDRFVQESLP